MTEDGKLPDGWQVLKFGEIAENINERVDDPSSSGLEHYVGLEHLDRDTLRISRWGSPSDVEATKLRFYPGDLIYARRRAYQRKLGVAQWDGVASAHSLVLRARPEVCLPEFLPYFLQSDQFHQRALDISVGSLSPTINWRTLAVQEFPVPALTEQEWIAEELEALDAVLAELGRSSSAADALREAMSHALFNGARETPRVHLTELVKRPIQYGVLKPGPEFPGGVYCVDVKDYPDGELDASRVRRIDPAIERQFSRSTLSSGDLLVSIRGTIGRVAMVPPELDGANISRDSARISLDKDVDAEYIRVVLEGRDAQKQMRARVVGLAVKGINIADLRRVSIPLPALSEQRQVARRSEVARLARMTVEAEAAELRRLRRLLLGTILVGAA